MSKPLNLFIRPPYRPGDTPVGHWKRLFGYGEKLPREWQQLGMGERSELVLLESDQDNVLLYAAASGFLSTRFPDDHISAPNEEILSPNLNLSEPESIIVYLHPRPFIDLYPGFKARADELFSNLLPILGLERGGGHSSSITGFLYLNIDVHRMKSLLFNKEALNELFNHTVSLRLGSTTLPPAVSESDFERRWQLFLEGKVDFPIRGGEEFGVASTPLVTSTNPNAHQMGFAVLTSDGTADPSRFYDWMRDFVVEETLIDDFRQLVPQNWPLIDPNLSTTELINLSSEEILPFAELNRIRNAKKLTCSQWRLIGNYQKALYRERLLKRVGLAPVSSTAPYFEFNNYEWKSIFQIEAITEFYANFSDPRVEGSIVQPDDQNYITVDLLPMWGLHATISGNHVTLDGHHDLNRITPGKDTIFFNTQNGPECRTIVAAYDIRHLSIDGEPILGSVTSVWNICLRPELVLIDGFGSRIEGEQASLENNPGAGLMIKLADADALDKINQFGFDTIYFHNDANTHFRPRTYSILAVNKDSKMISIEGTPYFENGVSTWQIPAGIGGKLPSLEYKLGKNASRGWDHYDAVLFVIQNGVVHDRFRWSSYTSHKYNPATSNGLNSRSSIRGNSIYRISSYRSGGAFKNFSFKVVDEVGLLIGHSATVNSSSDKTVQLDGDSDLSLIKHNGSNSEKDRIVFFGDIGRNNKTYRIDGVNQANRTLLLDGTPIFSSVKSGWKIKSYDGVRENRCYFEENVTSDNAASNSKPSGASGKSYIRLHYGCYRASGSGSAGCLVSPSYPSMRRRIIELYQEEQRLLNGMEDNDVGNIALADTQDSSKQLYSSLNPSEARHAWNDKIEGTLWLIRPDERPLD